MQIMKNLTREESILYYTALVNDGIEAFVIQTTENGVAVYSIEIEESSRELYRKLYPAIVPDDLSEALDSFNYMGEFEDGELLEIVQDQTSYIPLMVAKAKELLKARGIGFDEERSKRALQIRNENIRKVEEASSYEVRKNYLKMLTGGLEPVMVGWDWYTKKVKDTDGRIYNKYADKTRRHGLRTLILGTILFVISLAITVYVAAKFI
jgi:hypothetical protein